MLARRVSRMLLLVAGLGLAAGAAVAQQTTMERAKEVVAAPVGAANGDGKKLAFEVVSVRTGPADFQRFNLQWGLPDRFRMIGAPVETLLMLAYFGPVRTMGVGSSEKLVSGLPAWTEKLSVDVEGTVPPAEVEAYRKEGPDKPMLQQMLRTMLEERFGLVARQVTVDGPVFALEVGKKGALLKENKADDPDPVGGVKLTTGGWVLPYHRGETPRIRFVKVTMAEFVQFLSNSADRPVVDRTGLTGRYEFAVVQNDMGEASDPDPSVQWNVGDLGLRLVSTTAPREKLVVEKMEKPTEN